MKFHTTKSQADNAIWFQWWHEGYKFYIVVEQNVSESSWHFITRNGIIEKGLLSKELILAFRIFRLLEKLKLIRIEKS